MREIASDAEETKKPGKYSAYSRLSECLPLAASACIAVRYNSSSTAKLLPTSKHSALPVLTQQGAERQKSSIKCGRYQLSLSSRPLPLFSLSLFLLSLRPFSKRTSSSVHFSPFHTYFYFPFACLFLTVFHRCFPSAPFSIPPLIFIFPPVIVCVCALSLVSLNMLHVPRVISFEFELYNFIFNNNSLTLFITYPLYFQLLSSVACRT